MNIVFSNSDLLPKLTQVASIINPKSSLPILSDVHVVIKPDMLVLTGSDGETWITERIGNVTADEEFRCCIPASNFLKALRTLDDSTIKMTFNSDANTFTCDYGNGHFSMPYESAESYPHPSIVTLNMEDTYEQIINSKNLLQAIELTGFATANDELRPVMNGIHFDFFPKSMTCASSDGQKLVRFSDFSIAHFGDMTYSFTLPKKPATLALSILSSIDSDVKLSVSDKAMSIRNSDFKLVTRLIEGRYPRYESVIPKDCTITAILDKTAFSSALKRVLPMGNAQSMQVVLSFEADAIVVSAEDFDFSKSAKESIPCKHNAKEGFAISFKGTSLMEVLRNISDDNVVVEMSEPNRAAVFYAKDSLTKDEYLSLLMPMLISK